MTENSLLEVLDRGREAVEQENLDEARAACDQATSLAGENHYGVLHLRGLLAWADGDLEHAAGFLMQAADQGPNDAVIYLDCAELLRLDEPAEAEAAIRTMLDLDDLAEEDADQGRLILAQIRLDDDDAEEALELLDEVVALKSHPYYLATRAAVLLAMDKAGEAATLLEQAIEKEPEDPDLVYQLGITRYAGGELDASREAMLKVLAMDRADDELGDSLEPGEAEDLKDRLEQVLEELPDPLLKLVAGAPIEVAPRPTDAMVETGVDPRGPLAFLGTAAANEGDDAKLEKLVVMRNLLVDEIEEDDEIPEVFHFSLLAEFRRFFKREDIIAASITG